MRAQAATAAVRAFTRSIYGGHTYGHPGIGDPTGVQAITLDEIRAFHARNYRPSATTLVLAGDLDPAAAVTLLRQAIGDWEDPVAANDGSEAPSAAAAPPAARRVVLVPRPGAPQSELRVGQVSAARNTPDYHALLLWNAVLGGQFVSRLNLNLRQAKGYTYGVRSGFDFRRDRGPFSIHTSVQTTATADAMLEILREIAELEGDRPVTPPELARAKAAVGLGYPRSFETAQQVARAIVQMSLHDLDPDHFEQFVPRLNAVGLDTVTEAGRRHVQPTALTAVIVGDPEQVEPQLAAKGVAFERVDDPA
jgi:predicted Zn-dependent peptidase